MKTTKKLTAMLLSVIMVLSALSALPMTAGAAETTAEEVSDYTNGDYEYDLLDDGTVEITDYTGSATELTIPSTLDGYTVTSIGNSAFSHCTSLSSITIPSSITSIGSEAFYDCDNLTCINVVSENEYYSSEDGVLFSKDKTELIEYPAGKIGAYVIPDGVANIGDYAFISCDGLTSITITDGVTIIGSFAFNGCGNLTNATIGNGITIISEYAFSYCNNLISVTIEDGVKNIAQQAFMGCTNLSSINIPKK